MIEQSDHRRNVCSVVADILLPLDEEIVPFGNREEIFRGLRVDDIHDIFGDVPWGAVVFE